MFKFDNEKCYRMPAHFGGVAYNPDEKAVYHDVTALSYSIKTEAARLEQYIPEAFQLTKPELLIAFQQCREVDWMAGSYYNLIWVSAPVRFRGQKDEVEGAYTLVIWENKTTPILTGRAMGLPKIYADIEDLHIVGNTYSTRASYEGSTFLELEFHNPQPMSEGEVAALRGEVNGFGWRYVQRIGGPGAELSQPTLFPSLLEPTQGWTGSGSVNWTQLTWQQNPMQWHIIQALADLPRLETGPVTMTRGPVTLMDARGRVLS